MSKGKNTDHNDLGRDVTLWHKLLKAYKGVERDIGGKLKSNYRQSLSRFDVLEQLSAAPSTWITVGELSNRLLDTAGGISALLNRMESENLIERRLNPDDRRSFQVTLTSAGRSLHKKMSRDYTLWVTSAMGEFSEDERQLLAELLDRLNRPKGMPGTADT